MLTLYIKEIWWESVDWINLTQERTSLKYDNGLSDVSKFYLRKYWLCGVSSRF